MQVVAIDEGEDPELVKKFRDKHGVSYPVLLDPDHSVFPKLAGKASPWNIIVDGQGVVRYSAPGFSPGLLKSKLNETLQVQAKF